MQILHKKNEKSEIHFFRDDASKKSENGKSFENLKIENTRLLRFFIREKMLTIFGWNFEIWAVQKYVCKSCRSRQELSNEYLLAKIGVDTAENEPPKVWRKIQFIIHSPP